jgi:hypothetical protein
VAFRHGVQPHAVLINVGDTTQPLRAPPPRSMCSTEPPARDLARGSWTHRDEDHLVVGGVLCSTLQVGVRSVQRRALSSRTNS